MRRLSLLLCALLLALLPVPAHATADGTIPPVTVSNAANTLDVYEMTTASGSFAYWRSWTGGSWTLTWAQVSTVAPPHLIQGNVATVSPGNNYRFAILSDQNLYCQANPSANWTEILTVPIWTFFRQSATPAIMAVPRSVTRFAISDSGSPHAHIQTATFTIGSGCDSTKFSGFSDTGGQTDYSPAIAGTDASTDYFMAAIGVDTANNHVFWSYNGSAFQETADVGQSSGSPAVTTWGGGRYDLFVRGLGLDGLTYHNAQNTHWESIGGNARAGPGCTSWASGRIDCFVVGTNGDIYHNYWSVDHWLCGPLAGGGFTPGFPACWEDIGTA